MLNFLSILHLKYFFIAFYYWSCCKFKLEILRHGFIWFMTYNWKMVFRIQILMFRELKLFHKWFLFIEFNLILVINKLNIIKKRKMKKYWYQILLRFYFFCYMDFYLVFNCNFFKYYFLFSYIYWKLMNWKHQILEFWINFYRNLYYF